MENNDAIDKILNFIFSKNNVKYLIILFVIGFILRGIVAINIAPNADEMVHGTHALGILESKKLQIMDQDAVWFYLTDFFYRIFGENLFGLRFASVIFGSLAIFITYLIGKELFDKRSAIIASFILTFSSYHIIMSLAEMDVAMMFFVLFSIYFLIKAAKKQKLIYYILSSLFLGIAIMTKQIALLFIPAFIIFLAYYKIKNKEFNFNLKYLLYFLIIIFIAVAPILTFNYLLYKDKGLVDLQFSRFLGVGKETYASIETTLKPFRINDLFFSYENHSPGLYEGLEILYSFSPLLLIFGLIGLIINYKNKFFLLFLLSLLFPFIFLSGTSLLPIHFVFAVPLLSLFNAKFLDFLIIKSEKIRLKTRQITYLILLIILIISIIGIINEGAFRGKNEITNIIEFKKNNIEENSLVIVDNRVYRGRIAIIFNDRHYLEASYFNELLQKQEGLPGIRESISTYFIECFVDDCGWGTINNQPDFNRSMEEILGFFKNNSQDLGIIKNSFDENYFKIYKTNFELKSSSFEFADSTHQWFYYPLRYKGKSFDDYSIKGLFDNTLDKLAHYILYLEILIALLSPILLIYILFKEENET